MIVRFGSQADLSKIGTWVSDTWGVIPLNWSWGASVRYKISDETAGRISTVGELHEYVVLEFTRLGRPNTNRDITYDLLRNVICFQLGVEPDQVVPSARFVQLSERQTRDREKPDKT